MMLSMLIPVSAAESPTISMADETIEAGTSRNVKIELKDHPGIRAFTIKLEYDKDVFEIDKNSVKSDFVGIVYGSVSTGSKFVWASGSIKNGSYISFDLAVKSTAPGGKYELKIIVLEAADKNLSNVAFQVNSPFVTVIANNNSNKGDVNGDGKINAQDVIKIMRYLVGWSDYELDTALADYNGDGKVNIRDVCLILKDIVNGVH